MKRIPFVLLLCLSLGFTNHGTSGVGAESALPDGIVLELDSGPGAGEVTLSWTGALFLSEVFRFTDPAAVVDPAHKLGETSGSSWIDIPPATVLDYYKVLSQCDPEPEICDGLDNDCNGAADDGLPADSFEPNDSCAAFTNPAVVGSNQVQTLTSATVYPAGDIDIYHIRAEETDATCSCCDFFCLNEDFSLDLTLTVPVGAGSYRFCTGNSCAGVGDNCQEVAAGESAVWSWIFGGSCTAADSYDVFVRIQGDNAPGLQCVPYTLAYEFTPGCF